MSKKQKIFIASVATVVIIGVLVTSLLLFSAGKGSPYTEHMLLAQQYIDELQYEQAIAELQAAIDIDPEKADAYIMLSDLYQKLGDLDSALKVLEDCPNVIENAIMQERIAEQKELVAQLETEPLDADVTDIDIMQEKTAEQKKLIIQLETYFDEDSTDIDMEPEELDLTLQDIATAEENEPVSYEYRVYLTNPYDLYISSLPSHGFGTFEGYLARYIDYYLPGEEYYGVEFIVGSDETYEIITVFYVTIEDLDVIIRCVYNASSERYSFVSSLDGSELIF